MDIYKSCKIEENTWWIITYKYKEDEKIINKVVIVRDEHCYIAIERALGKNINIDGIKVNILTEEGAWYMKSEYERLGPEHFRRPVKFEWLGCN